MFFLLVSILLLIQRLLQHVVRKVVLYLFNGTKYKLAIFLTLEYVKAFVF